MTTLVSNLLPTLTKSCLNSQSTYHKIPINSPGLYFVRKGFWWMYFQGGLLSEGLIIGIFWFVIKAPVCDHDHLWGLGTGLFLCFWPLESSLRD